MPKPISPYFQNIFIIPPPLIYQEIKCANKQNLLKLLNSCRIPPKIDLAEALTLAIPHPAIFKILLDTYQINDFRILGDALQLAAKNNYQAIVTLLLDYLDREDIYFSVPLELQSQHPEEMLEQKINKGMALIYASEEAHLEALNALLENKSILELAAWCKNTPLCNAQEKKHNATTKEERKRYNQVIARLTDIPTVAQLAEQKGEIFEKMQPSEANQAPILITFHSLETDMKKENALSSDNNGDQELPIEPLQSSCRIS